MKNVTLILLAMSTTLALGACATSPGDATTAQKPLEEKEYRTGSRIPVRDSSTGASPTKTLDPSVLGSGVPAARTN